MTDQQRKDLTELFVLSAVALFAELLAIRWLGSDIRAFIVFRTFPLVTCFIGMGVGFASKSDAPFKFTAFAVFLFAAVMKLAEVSGLAFLSFPSLSVFQWQLLAVDAKTLTAGLQLMVALTAMLAAPFFLCMCLGTRLAVLFRSANPLACYSVNLLGSIAGSVLFAIISFLGCPPWYALILVLIPVLIYGWKQIPFQLVAVATVVAIPLLSFIPAPQAVALSTPLLEFQDGPTQTFWSPYQRLDLTTYSSKTEPKQFYGLELGANRAFYQYMLNDDLDPRTLPGSLPSFYENRRRLYELPFELKPSESVLVVGAGTGQNMAAALRHGAKSVDAVDIDPKILDLGKQYNSLYSHSRVHLVCNDARQWFRSSPNKYDLIVYMFLDSQAVVGSGSSVRLDTYIYTKESFQQCLKLLKPDGVICVCFASFQPWISERISRTLEAAAGYPPLVLKDQRAETWRSSTYFLVGEPVRRGEIKLPPGWQSVQIPRTPANRELSDDWPYLYVRTDVFDTPYALAVAEVLLLSFLATRTLLLKRGNPTNWQLFFLGAAFMLLELHAVSLSSLGFGSTWLTSAVVINCVLVFVLIANLVVIRFRQAIAARLVWVYGALLASIIISYFVPSGVLLDSYGVAGRLLVTAISLVPLVFAGLVFSASFAESDDPPTALAFNLLGSILGGLLEYVSNYTGIKELELVAAALYIVSLACFLTGQRKSGPAV